MIELLQAIALTLEDIEVHGSTNMSKLLGCIQALNKIIADSESAETTKGGEET